MLTKTVDIVSQLLNLIVLSISIVERPGYGAEKKAEAIQIIKSIADSTLPSWVSKLLVNDTTLNILIDYIVDRFNKEKVFDH